MNARSLALGMSRLLLPFGVLACGAGWHRIAPSAPKALPARQQVQVWQHGTPQRWHAVRLTADSISGIPYLQRTDCGACRVGVPAASVDSLRLGDPVAGFWKSVGLVAAGFVGLGIYVCRNGCAP